MYRCLHVHILAIRLEHCRPMGVACVCVFTTTIEYDKIYHAYRAPPSGRAEFEESTTKCCPSIDRETEQPTAVTAGRAAQAYPMAYVSRFRLSHAYGHPSSSPTSAYADDLY